MATILPYVQNINNNEGAFIDQNGNIIYATSNPIETARKIILGGDYNLLKELKEKENLTSSDIRYLKRNFSIKRNEIKALDEYMTSKLTSHQLDLWEKWLSQYDYDGFRRAQDFLVLVCNYDRIESMGRQYITTACDTPHIRFFNYMLMDWDIDTKSPIIWDPNENAFIQKESFCNESINSQDKEYAQEIDNIKSQVLVKDRHLFFKK